MNKPKISVIVPVYNTKIYLQQCLDSIINQTFKDIEVICIDNGSTDGSFELLKEYETCYENFIVLKYVIGHQGGARNEGLKRAKGEYISFVDSDDYILPDMFQNMFQKIVQNKADVIICGIKIYLHKKNKYKYTVKNESLPINSCFKSFQYPQIFRNLALCNKLFRHEFIKRYRVLFPAFLYNQDQMFVFKSYVLANRISFLNKPLYIYRKQRNGSVSEHKGLKSFDIFQVMDLIKNFLLASGNWNDYKNIFVENMIVRYLFWFEKCNLINKYHFFQIMKKEFRDITLHKNFKIITPSEYHIFKIITQYNFLISYIYLLLKQFWGKILSVSVLKKIYGKLRRIKY